MLNEATIIQPTWQQACGIVDEHIIAHCMEGIDKPVHHDVVEPFLQLQADAKAAGFDMQIVSGFRDYSRQRLIWNAKAAGDRELLSSDGTPLVFETLTDQEKLHAIMRWSALPGASRHHWGTDIDIYDAAALPDDYQIQLTPDEVEGGGMFAPMHDWLDERIELNKSYGFFRPYAHDTNGIAPERWHLSYAPLAVQYQTLVTPERLIKLAIEHEVLLMDCINDGIDMLFKRYVTVDKTLYPSAYRQALS